MLCASATAPNDARPGQRHPFSSEPTLPVQTLLQSVLEGLKHCTISGVRVIGPHGAGEMTVGCQLSPPDSFRRYDTVVMIGGGVGVSLNGSDFSVGASWSGLSGAPALLCICWMDAFEGEAWLAVLAAQA